MLPVSFARRVTSPIWSGGRFDPSAEFDRLTSLFDGGEPQFGVRLDVREDEGHYFVDVDLPGFTKNDIDVTFQEGVLTISGERKREEKKEGENYHYIERRSGQFARTVRLPDAVKQDTVDATLKDGVLTVRIDKADEIKPRKIEVKG